MDVGNEFDRLNSIHPLEYKRRRAAAIARAEKAKGREPHIGAGWTPADWGVIYREVRKIARRK